MLFIHGNSNLKFFSLLFLDHLVHLWVFLNFVINLQKIFQHIYWKKSMHKWTLKVWTHVVQGWPIVPFGKPYRTTFSQPRGWRIWSSTFIRSEHNAKDDKEDSCPETYWRQLDKSWKWSLSEGTAKWESDGSALREYRENCLDWANLEKQPDLRWVIGPGGEVNGPGSAIRPHLAERQGHKSWSPEFSCENKAARGTRHPWDQQVPNSISTAQSLPPTPQERNNSSLPLQIEHQA